MEVPASLRAQTCFDLAAALPCAGAQNNAGTFELDVDAVTASWLPPGCSRREDVADVAAAALRGLAMAEAVDNLKVFYDRPSDQWLEDSVRETETAVAYAS